MKTNEQRTNEIIATHYGFSVDCIKPEQRLEEDLEGDSLDRVELVMAIEDEFGVQIPDGVWENLTTVAEVHAMVAAHVKELA